MLELLEPLSEADVADLLRKQRSITRLFPKFYDRVKAVAAKGGIRLVATGRDRDGKGVWDYKVHSGTQDGLWYDVKLRFMDMLHVLNVLVADRRLWKTDGSGVDLRRLSPAVYDMVQIQTKCECPADLYWGKQYIRSRPKYDANVPPPEDRPPVVRNPHEYGAFCKHTQMLVNLLPMYTATFAKFLAKYYGDTIRELEKEARRMGTTAPETTAEETPAKRGIQPPRPPRPPISGGPRPPVPPRAPVPPRPPVPPVAPKPPKEK